MRKFIVLITVINIGLLAGIIFLLQKNVEKEVPVVRTSTAQAIDRCRFFLGKGDYVIKKELSGIVLGENAVKQQSYRYDIIDDRLLVKFAVYKAGDVICTIDGNDITAAHDMRVLSYEMRNNNLTIDYIDYSLVSIELNFPADQLETLSYELPLYVTIGKKDYEKSIQSIDACVVSNWIPVRIEQEGYLLPGTEVKGYFIEDIYYDVVTIPTKYLREDNRGYYLWTDAEGNEAEKVYYTVVLHGEDRCIINIDEEYTNGIMQTEFD